jgi:hypothetical protein
VERGLEADPLGLAQPEVEVSRAHGLTMSREYRRTEEEEEASGVGRRRRRWPRPPVGSLAKTPDRVRARSKAGGDGRERRPST